MQSVIAHVQAGFASEQQQTQDQVSQAIQGLQGAAQSQAQTQDQMRQLGAVVEGLQATIQQVATSVSSLQAQATRLPASPPGSPLPNGGGNTATPPSGTQGGAAGGATSSGVSPAVAYAIQQGGIDGRSLGKPQTFDPASTKVSFQDWSELVITVCESIMPGIYEVMEYIVNEQPKQPIASLDIKIKFPNIGPLLVDYGESQIFAMLTTYTVGEARSLVRQAKRPRGFEAFRLLHVRFNPITIRRQRAHLIRITNPTENVALDKLAAEIVSWENRIIDYESRPGAEKVSESMKMAATVHMCPKKLQDHLQLNAVRYSTYLELREEIFTYLDEVAPAVQTAVQTAMDVGSVGVAKGGGCYLCGGPHLMKDCKKGKGKSKDGKDGGKGKFGKGFYDSGKGKGKGKHLGDGKGKQGKKGAGKPAIVCYNCGKTRDTKDQCWQKTKALNAVDPKLSELQSMYARAALEEFNKMSSSPVAAASPAASGQASTPSSPPARMPVSTGSLVVKSLCAISHWRKMPQSCSASGSGGWKTEQGKREIHAVMSGSYPLTLAVDSVAAASVAPANTFAGYMMLQPDESLQFQSANGELVPELFKVEPVVMTEEGLLRTTKFSVAQVHKPLISAAQIANTGHRIVLEPEGGQSYIEELSTGQRMQLHQEDGVYVQKLWVVDAQQAGFTGPAPCQGH